MSDDEWKSSYEQIKAKHDEAFQVFEVGARHDVSNNPDLALANYKLTIALIDEALATPVALPEDPDQIDETWNSALKMIQRLKRTRAELVQRVGALSPTTSEPTISMEARAPETRPRTFSELAEDLTNMELNMDQLPSVLELLFLCEGVKLYHISSAGGVTTTSENCTLRIIRIDQDVVRNLEATCFMQIIRTSMARPIENILENLVEVSTSSETAFEHDKENVDAKAAIISQDQEEATTLTNLLQEEASTVSRDSPKKEKEAFQKYDSSLIYPLIPGASPCFRTDYGAFIFPDIESEVRGEAYGLVIPSGSDEIVLEILEAILHGVVRQEEAKDPEEEGARMAISEKISENIVTGACFISNGLVKGSEQFGKLVTYSTPFIMSKLNKAPENTAPMSNKVLTGVELAKSATSVAVTVTGYVAGKVGCATMALGRFLAPHVQAQGSRLLSKTTGISHEDASEKVCTVFLYICDKNDGTFCNERFDFRWVEF